MYSSNRPDTDWCMAAAEEKTRKNTHCYDFVKAMTTYYKPTENIMLKLFQSNIQKHGEIFLRNNMPFVIVY